MTVYNLSDTVSVHPRAYVGEFWMRLVLLSCVRVLRVRAGASATFVCTKEHHNTNAKVGMHKRHLHHYFVCLFGLLERETLHSSAQQVCEWPLCCFGVRPHWEPRANKMLSTFAEQKDAVR